MRQSRKTTVRPRTGRTLARAGAAVLFSVILGASGHALAAPHGGGFHGGGLHGRGFHGGGFHAGLHAGGFRGGGFHAGRFRGGFYHGFYPGFGLGLAYGLGYPWGWGYYPPYDSYYGDAEPNAVAQNWYYCSSPAGYYPYVTQCYGPWQVVPAS